VCGFHFFIYLILFIFIAVRLGNVPKREKAKILAAMQSVNARLTERSLPAEFDDEVQLFQSVVFAHMETCDFTRKKVQILNSNNTSSNNNNNPVLIITVEKLNSIFLLLEAFGNCHTANNTNAT
jgi:hypothetical protein